MKFLLSILFTFSFLMANSQTFDSVLNEMKSIAKNEQNSAQNALNAQKNAKLMSGASNNFDVKHYKCEWQIDPAIKYIRGKVRTTFTTNTQVNNIIFDLTSTLIVDSVLYKNVKTVFIQNPNNTVTVNFATTINNNVLDSVTIYYKGIPDAGNTGSFAQSVHAGVPIIWTLSEPYGAKDWWPCKDVLNDKADSIEIVITSPDAYKSSSNGVIISDVLNAGKRITTFKHKYPIASYLVAMACTNYNFVSTTFTFNGITMPVETWAYPENANQFAAEQYGVNGALQQFSEYFGDYPFMKEKYAQTQFGRGGGMEHQTNSFVGYAGHLLQAHELGHQWFGDKTTCGSWKDIWLNEGFATFSHWLYFEKFYKPIYESIISEYHNEVTSDSTGSVYVPDTTSIGRIFSWRYTYVKGSYVLRMLQGMLGDAMFFQCMKNYGLDAATKYSYAKTEDVQRVFEQTSGKNLKEFFKDWIYGEGWPMYNVQWYKNNNGYYNIKINQKQSHPSVSFYEMPLRIKFKNATQDSTIVLDVQQNGQLFSTKLNFIPDTVLIDPDMWLLSKNNTQQELKVPTVNNLIQVTPNPSNNSNWFVTIKNPTTNNYVVRLFNTAGQLVYNNILSTTGFDLKQPINNDRMSAGVYTLVINDGNNNIFNQKLVK
jgi:aminopeptidase N